MTIFRYLLIAALLGFLTSCATAQRGSVPATVDNPLSKKDAKAYAAARSDFELGAYDRALPEVERLLQKYPDFPSTYALRSSIRKARADYAGALADARRFVELSPSPRAAGYREIGELAALNDDFAGSLAAYEQYLELYATASPQRRAGAEALVERARFAAQLAANPVPFSPQPLGENVNTVAHLEYFPTVSADGSRLIFTRRVDREQEDFYFSDRTEDGSWGPASPLPGVNTPDYNEGAQTLSGDGRYLVFTACDRPGGKGGCDLYFSERGSNGGWSRPRNLGPQVNTRYYEAQPSLSADGTSLLFTSNRPGGQGAEDIYLSRRDPEGGWSPARNLGAPVNTSGKDNYPFWAADNRTLYFTSTGHPGLGGADLFVTHLDGEFSEPRNLGYPINTAGEETNLFVTLDGATAYFSKGVRRPGTTELDVDLFSFNLPPHLRPRPATYLRATVMDAVTGEPLRASVRLRSTEPGPLPSLVESGTDGKFLTVLPAGEEWALTVDRPGYLFYTQRFSLTDGFTQEDPYELTIALQPLTDEPPQADERAEADGAIAFRNVLFATGSARLKSASVDELERLGEVLLAAPALAVEIVGHTDDVGDNTANQQLSEARARAVRDYLVDWGVPPGRISAAGRGEDKPVATNATEEGRAANRRVTFRLYRP